MPFQMLPKRRQHPVWPAPLAPRRSQVPVKPLAFAATRPESVQLRGMDADEDDVGGDDAADCLRYPVATKSRAVAQRKLRGL
jgi:hypothetical protein